MPSQAHSKPRVGIPWRTAQEEADGNLSKIKYYCDAVEAAGGQAIPISLLTSQAELDSLAETLDAVILPGSPTDVDPLRYGVPRHARCADPDPARERTDYTLLDHVLAAHKPVLAICYGTQLLNVYLSGKLIQDIPSEFRTKIRHDKKGLPPGSPDPRHPARIEPGSRLAELAELAGVGLSVEVNSSHHQAILSPGLNLRVTAQAPDGIVEAVEGTGGGHWIVGVQWHPERMAGDALAATLFRELITAARGAATTPGRQTNQA